MHFRRASYGILLKKESMDRFSVGMSVCLAGQDKDMLRGDIVEMQYPIGKIMVFWHGGTVKQHDPEDLFPIESAGNLVIPLGLENGKELVPRFPTSDSDIPSEILDAASDMLDAREKNVDFASRSASGKLKTRRTVRCATEAAKEDVKSSEIPLLRARRVKKAAEEMTTTDPDKLGQTEPLRGGFSIMQDFAESMRKEHAKPQEPIEAPELTKGSLVASPRRLRGSFEMCGVDVFLKGNDRLWKFVYLRQLADSDAETVENEIALATADVKKFSQAAKKAGKKYGMEFKEDKELSFNFHEKKLEGFFSLTEKNWRDGKLVEESEDQWSGIDEADIRDDEEGKDFFLDELKKSKILYIPKSPLLIHATMKKEAVYRPKGERIYRKSKLEEETGELQCPKCKSVGLEKHPFLRGKEVFVCPNCGWGIESDKIL